MHTVESQAVDTTVPSLPEYEAVLRPWEGEPFQLVSWADMEQFKAEIFYRLAKILERMRIHYGLDVAVGGDPSFSFKSALDLPVEESQQQELAQLCVSASTLCQQIGLRQSVKCARAFWSELAVETPQGGAILKVPPSRRHVSYLVRELDHSIDREMEDNLFMYIPTADAEYYNQPSLFGERVNLCFPSAANDIREAGDCYAAGRSTACVFHLMRAIEVGLRAMGQSLGDPNFDPRRNPTWEAILKPCDDELKKSFDKRSHQWRQENEFFSNATANLRAVKDAWRNPTLHVERDYTQPQALQVLNAVKAFMEDLARKLRQ
jgi:hypothetical protein